jgi:ATP-dependent RNA helicase DDX35
MKKLGQGEMVSCGVDTVALRKCLVSGYFSQAARMLPDGSFVSIRDQLVYFSIELKATCPNSFYVQIVT